MDYRLILIIFSLFCFSINAKEKAKTYLIIEQNQSELIEQISLVLYPKKAILSMNSNQWSIENKIGKFEIRDEKILKEIDKSISSFYYKYSIPKDTYVKHQAVLIIDKKRIPPESIHYENAFKYIKSILKYNWVGIDTVTVKINKKSVTAYAKEKNRKVKTTCQLRNKNQICVNEYGIIYLKN